MIPSPSHVGLQVDDTYLPETWVWFVFGVIVITLRYAVRLRTVSLRGFDGDDCCMIITLALWIIDAVIIQITYYTGGSIDVTADVVPLLSDRDVAILVYGTKWEYASFYTYSALIWTLKFCVLFFYRRLKADEWRQSWLTVNRLFILNGIAYLALCLTAVFSCWPFQLNWSVRPIPPLRCTFRPQNFWTLVVLNVLTDTAILSVPVPILWHIRVSKMRRLGVTLLLCSGLFLISTAVIRAVFTIGGSPSIITINRWGVRETGVGLLAINAPVLAPLFSKPFWRRGTYRPGRAQARGQRVVFQPGWPERTKKQLSIFHIPSAMSWTKSGSSRSTGARKSTAVKLPHTARGTDALELTHHSIRGASDFDLTEGDVAGQGDLEAGTEPLSVETSREWAQGGITRIGEEK